MDKKYLQSVIPFAASANLKVDNASGTIFGTYKGFSVMLFPLFNLRSFQLSVAVKRQGVSPSLPEICEYAKKEMGTFWEEYKRLIRPHKYKVDLTDKLFDLKKSIMNSKNKPL